MKSGIINIYKEEGYTSFDVVAKLRGILGIRKIGHTGTLDPAATGVLPVCIGKATKVCDLLTDKDKTYRAVMRLGFVTDTQDMTGKILEEHPVEVSEEQIKDALLSFVGKTEQIPPMYSALKVNGKKLCDLARQGIEVERKPREIYISKLQIQNIQLPLVTFEVTCSKGTYIRTLCEDVGKKLGCGACMDSLIRTRVAGFQIEDSITLDQVQQLKEQGCLEKKVIPVDVLFEHYPKVYGHKEAAGKLRNGNALCKNEVSSDLDFDNEEQRVRMYMQDETFVGIFIWNGQVYKPEKMFLE